MICELENNPFPRSNIDDWPTSGDRDVIAMWSRCDYVELPEGKYIDIDMRQFYTQYA